MKTRLIALVLALAACPLAGLAQETPQPPAATPAVATEPAPAPATEPPTPAQPDPAAPAPAGGAPAEATPAADPNEQVPLIVIDDVPLTDAIRNLARQSSLNFQFDPRITATNQAAMCMQSGAMPRPLDWQGFEQTGW